MKVFAKTGVIDPKRPASCDFHLAGPDKTQIAILHEGRMHVAELAADEAIAAGVALIQMGTKAKEIALEAEQGRRGGLVVPGMAPGVDEAIAAAAAAKRSPH